MRMLMLGWLLPLLVLAAPASGQDRAESMRTQIDAALADTAQPDGPGAVVLVAHGDSIVYRGARGMANVELGVPLSPDQLFRIASITKSFTAALVVQMAERGELSLDDPLARFLPGRAIDPAITVRRLLNHTAGIGERDAIDHPSFGWGEIPLAEQLDRIVPRPPGFAPGTDQRYSNSGYVLLAAVIEQVTGKRWDEAMRERLFDPLGLDRTRYDRATDIAPGRVQGYTHAGGALRNAPFFNMSLPRTAGSLRSTAEELFRFMRALSRGRIVSPAAFADMAAPARADAPPQQAYGLGLYRWTVRGTPAIGHTGEIAGFASALLYLPDADATVVILANDDGFDAQTFARRVAAIAIGDPFPVVRAGAPTPAALAALAGRYAEGTDQARVFAVQDGTLTSARPGRPPLPLLVDSEGRIRFLPDELSYFEPVFDRAGAVIRLDYYPRGEGPPIALARTAAAD